MESIINFIKKYSQIFFFIICWAIAFLVIRCYYEQILHCGLSEMKNQDLIIIAVGIGFILLPFFKKLKFGDFELEIAVTETKKDLSEFKKEVKNEMILLSTNISTISNLSNNVTINVPGIQELKEEIKKIISNKNQVSEPEVDVIKHEMILDDEDNLVALARTRIRIEYLLRKIVVRSMQLNPEDNEFKYASLHNLIPLFVKLYPEYKELYKSFDYVRRITNAASHGQMLSEGQATEALDLGARLIAILKEIEKQNTSS